MNFGHHKRSLSLDRSNNTSSRNITSVSNKDTKTPVEILNKDINNIPETPAQKSKATLY